MTVFKVEITKKAIKDLQKVPDYIVLKLNSWVQQVGDEGLREVRKIPGYHDEPLQGKRKGRRSIRLSKQYRAIYKVVDARVAFVSVIEVNSHKY